MYHLCIKMSQCKIYVVINDFQLLISSEFFLGKQTNGIWALLLNTLKQLPSQKKRTFYHVIWMNQIFLIVMISSWVRKHHKKHNTPRYINYANYTSKGYGIFTHSAMVIHGIKALLVSSTAIGSFNIKYDIQLLCIIFDAKIVLTTSCSLNLVIRYFQNHSYI